MKRLIPVLPLYLILSLTCGCSTPRFFTSHQLAGPDNDASTSFDCPRHLPMFAGHSGEALGWQDVHDAIDWAEIVILGEQHDDAMAHATQLIVVEQTLDRWPRSAIAMEMLERDEQALVDDYLDGIIDAETFVRFTFSENWAGDGSWYDWYQPIVDAAKARKARVIAANAPRRYVRYARLAGYAAMEALPPQRRVLFDLPRRLPRDSYFVRFREVMSHIDDINDVRAIFRSQMVWDATMGRSIVDARPNRAAKVVHLVGRFHSDFQGGTVKQIRAHRPQARILVLSMIPTNATALREEDRNRADIVIYTGDIPEPEEDEIDDEPEVLPDEDQIDADAPH